MARDPMDSVYAVSVSSYGPPIGIIILSALIWLLVVGGIYVWTSLAFSAMFRKAGEPAWAGWVPVYNIMVVMRMAGYSEYLGLLTLVGAGPILLLIASLRINRSFGVPAGFAVLALLLPPVWASILGWGKDAQWHGVQAADTWGGAQPTHAGLDALGFAPVGDSAYGAAQAAPAGAQGWGAPVADAPAWGTPTNAGFGEHTALVQPDAPQPAWPGTAAETPTGIPVTDAWNAAPAPAQDGWNAAPAPAQDGWNAAPAPAQDGWNAAPAPAPDPWNAAPGAPVTDAWNAAPAPAIDPWNAGPAAPAHDPWNAAPAGDAANAAPAHDPRNAAPPAPTADAWSAAAAPHTDSLSAGAEVSQAGWSPAPAVPATAPQDAWAPPAAAAPFGGADIPPAPAMPASVAAAAATNEEAAAQWAAAQSAAVPAEENPVAVQAGATRMRDDAEVVAQARAAMSVPPVNPADVAVSDDAHVGPIIVPGPSGQLPGAVPPPMMSDGLEMSESIESSQWGPRLRGEVPPLTVEPSLESSVEVSAVAGAPEAGAPRSARSTVSAQHSAPEVPATPEDADGFDATEIAVRHRPVWVLTTPTGAPVSLTSDVIVLGRKPGADASSVGAQLVPVADGTRTVSKTHARLELVNGVWHITDLGSTNGVVLVAEDGTETEVATHVATPVTERFLLGDAELRLSSAAQR